MNCLQCQTPFPVRTFINGRQRNLQRRKYCLECSPFGKHNTRNLEKGPTPSRICSICQKPFFYKGTVCSSCRVTKWRQERKKELVLYKGGKCILCGYDRCVANMTFHHLDPNKKDFQISGMTCSFERLKREADKCVLLCCRCHGEVHAGLVSIPV